MWNIPNRSCYWLCYVLCCGKFVFSYNLKDESRGRYFTYKEFFNDYAYIPMKEWKCLQPSWAHLFFCLLITLYCFWSQNKWIIRQKSTGVNTTHNVLTQLPFHRGEIGLERFWSLIYHNFTRQLRTVFALIVFHHKLVWGSKTVKN